jgi:hypothetical protein
MQRNGDGYAESISEAEIPTNQEDVYAAEPIGRSRNSFQLAFEVAADIASDYGDKLWQEANAWVGQEEMSGRLREAARACDYLAMKIRSAAANPPPSDRGIMNDFGS